MGLEGFAIAVSLPAGSPLVFRGQKQAVGSLPAEALVKPRWARFSTGTKDANGITSLQDGLSPRTAVLLLWREQSNRTKDHDHERNSPQDR